MSPIRLLRVWFAFQRTSQSPELQTPVLDQNPALEFRLWNSGQVLVKVTKVEMIFRALELN